MSFGSRITDYLLGLVDNSPVAKQLPFRSTASQRLKRMSNRDRAIDWRLQVQDQCAEVRKTIEADRSVGILKTEVEMLLYLLGEHNKGEDNGD